MKFVAYCDLFLIENQTIDTQHQVLFEITNRFHREVRQLFNRDNAIAILTELIQYAQKHFTAEEAIIEKSGMPKELVTRHKEIHGRLVEDIFKLNEEITSGKIKSRDEIETFLTEWLVLHILIEDKKLRKYLT